MLKTIQPFVFLSPPDHVTCEQCAAQRTASAALPLSCGGLGRDGSPSQLTRRVLSMQGPMYGARRRRRRAAPASSKACIGLASQQQCARKCSTRQGLCGWMSCRGGLPRGHGGGRTRQVRESGSKASRRAGAEAELVPKPKGWGVLLPKSGFEPKPVRFKALSGTPGPKPFF